MAHTKRTHTTPKRQPAAKEPTAASRGGTLALFATLALSLGTAIAAAAWLIATHEPTGMTATRMTMPDASYRPAAVTAPAATASASATEAASAPLSATIAASTQTTQQATAQQPAASSGASKTSGASGASGSSAPPAPAAPLAAGQRAFIDPVTGELRQPEHEELAAIAAAAAAAAPASRSAAAARTASVATASFGPDGSVDTVVPEDLHTFTVATRGPDGRIVIEHAQGAANAAKLVKANSAKKGPQASVSRAQQKEDRNDR